MPTTPKTVRPSEYLLPHAKLKQLRKLHPCTEETRSKLFKLYVDLTSAVRDELLAIDGYEKYRYEKLSPTRRTVLLVDDFEADVRNGGFEQYYGNSFGNGADRLPAALREVGQPKVAKIVERANAQFPDGPPRNPRTRDRVMSRIHTRASKAWDRATDQFFDLPFPLNGLGLVAVVPFILEHETEFFEAEKPTAKKIRRKAPPSRARA